MRTMLSAQQRVNCDFPACSAGVVVSATDLVYVPPGWKRKPAPTYSAEWRFQTEVDLCPQHAEHHLGESNATDKPQG